MPQQIISFIFGFVTGLSFWGIHVICRRLKTRKLQKEHDKVWDTKEPYVQ